MSEPSTSGGDTNPTPVQMPPEVAQARDSLATYEGSVGNQEWASQFREQQFTSIEEVHAAYEARTQATGTPEPQAGQAEPELYAGKYKTIEELVKGYKELESARGKASQQTTPEETPGTEGNTEEGSGLEIGKPKATEVTFEELSKHYAEHGELHQTQYDSVKEVLGMEKAEVDNIIKLAQAGAQAQASQVSQQGKLRWKTSTKI